MPGTGPAGPSATNGSPVTTAPAGGIGRAGAETSRVVPAGSSPTSSTHCAAVGVVPRRCTTATPAPRPTVTPAIATQGCSTSSRRHPVARGPAGPGRSRTRRSRPSRCMRQTRVPSSSSSTVDWPSAQSGAWNSASSARSGTASHVSPSGGGAARAGNHHPERSSTTSRSPSRHHRGWPTEIPAPPTTVTVGPRETVPSPSWSAATRTADSSQGIAGWSQVVHASQRPSGDGRGAATKSPTATSGTSVGLPSSASATRRWSVPSGPRRSSTVRSQAPDGVTRPSA